MGNQKEVDRWIDVLVSHGGVAPLGAAGKAPTGGLLLATVLSCKIC